MPEEVTVNGDGSLTFPKLYKNYRVKTVIIQLPEPMWRAEFLRRCAPILPKNTGFNWFKGGIEFEPIPDKLIKDVTQEMKGGD